MTPCSKCGAADSDYTSPANLCEKCWLDWWYENYDVSPEELEKIKKEDLENA